MRTWTPFSEMAMTEAFAHFGETPGHRCACSRTRGKTPSDTQRRRRGVLVLLALGLLALILGMTGWIQPAGAAEPDTDPARILPQGPLNFDACARLAIQQSPYFKRSSMEVDIRRLDENDSRYTMFPPSLTFRTYYYVDRPSGINSKPYSLAFNMEPYNPVGSYFSLQIQKMITQIAIFGHVKMISEGLERLGKIFLSLSAFKQINAYQDDLINLAKENLTFAENRLSIGTGTSLDVRVATQELELAKAEKERQEVSWKRSIGGLKNFLGLPQDQPIELDLKDTRRQVLGSFEPAEATLQQTKDRSLELKVLELKKEMQGYHIMLAKARVLPNLLFTAQTPDPMYFTSNHGVYAAFGLEIPVWDGFKRIRDISRQKAVLKQFGADKDVKEMDVTDKWSESQENIKFAAVALKMAQSQEELARLKERQSQIRYQSGTELLPFWLEARKASLEARKGAISRSLDYDEAILSLRQLCGDLGNNYVDQKSWQQ